MPRDRLGRYVITAEVARDIAAGLGVVIDAPGLPLDALADPSMREALTRLRFEREHRLMALIRRSR
ncbi:hypothetical protein [Nocardia sp. NPDC004415]